MVSAGVAQCQICLHWYNVQLYKHIVAGTRLLILLSWLTQLLFYNCNFHATTNFGSDINCPIEVVLAPNVLFCLVVNFFFFRFFSVQINCSCNFVCCCICFLLFFRFVFLLLFSIVEIEGNVKLVNLLDACHMKLFNRYKNTCFQLIRS